MHGRRAGDALQRIETRLLRQDVSHRMRVMRERLSTLDRRLIRAEGEVLVRLRTAQTNAESLLLTLSPLAVLQRGYALVFDDRGVLVKDAFAAQEGSLLTTRFSKSRLTSRVVERKTEKIGRMKKLFGTDGIRAVAGEAPLDAKTIFATGLALAHSLSSKDLPAPQVLLGADTRESSPWISAVIAAGLSRGGAQVLSAGVITTPGVAYLTRQHRFAAGVVISASHNPWQDNGIKVFGSDGYKLPDRAELEIEGEIFRRLALLNTKADTTTGTTIDMMDVPDTPDLQALEAPPVEPAFRLQYEAFLRNLVPGLNLKGKKIVIDCANGAAAAIAPELFAAFGGILHLTHVTPNGRNINENCGALHPEVVAKETKALGADLGITFDGDADRALFADARGHVVNGDGVMLVTARDMQRKGALTGNLVVATTMSNMGLESALLESGIKMLRAPVGDKYVLDMMQKHEAALGGEQSGHILFPRHSTTGDGLLTALILLDLIERSGKPLHELAAGLRVFPQVIVNVRVREKRPLDQIPTVVASIERAETDLDGNGRVVVRYSGTEALARVMIEAESEQRMREHADRIAQAIRTEIGA